MERKFIRLLSALFIGLFVICSLKIDSLAFSGGYGVRITGSNQAVDSIEMNGRVIQAIYRPYDGTNGTDTTYSCAAFVKRFYRDAYGIDVYNLSSTTSTPLILSGGGNFSLTSSPKKGDIVRDNKSTHWAIVKSVEADGKIYVIQQNAWLSNRTEAWVGAYTSVSDSNYSFFTYSGSGSGSTDTEPPVISNAAITNVTNTGYTVTCTVTDNTGVSKVEFPTWKVSDTSVGCTWYRGTQHGSTYTFTFQGADRDGNYLTHIYAFDSAGNSSSISLEEIYIDRIPPVISNISVTNETSTGYAVRCTVMDNSGEVKWVLFPTWTDYNGQDDLQQEWQGGELIDESTYLFMVHDLNHNNERGTYVTQIYAYDSVGNYSYAEVKADVKNTYEPIATMYKNGHIYKVYDDILSWKDAKVFCEQNGGYLATITSEEEMLLIKDLFKDKAKREAYMIGLTDEGDKGNYRWITGEPYLYSYWSLGTPNNIGGQQDFGYMCLSGTWDDGKNLESNAGFIYESGSSDKNTEEPLFPSFPFSDITQNPADWKYESVKYVYDHKIMNGISNTDLFQPDHFLTRSMFATVLYRMAGEPPVTFKKLFSDVDDGQWYSNAIVWASEQKIVSGYTDGRYGINDNITREQIAKMLYEYAKSNGNDVSMGNELGGFTDSSIVSDWAVVYMKWATAAGMITGKPNGNGSFRLDPKGQATRAECAKMITMFMKMYGE